MKNGHWVAVLGQCCSSAPVGEMGWSGAGMWGQAPAALLLLLGVMFGVCGGLELEGVGKVRWTRLGGYPEAVVLGAVSAKYAQSTYLPGMAIDNIDVVQSSNVMAFRDEKLSLETAVFDPLASLLHSFFPAPHMDNITTFHVLPLQKPSRLGVQELQPSYCDRIASPLLTYDYGETLESRIFSLAGLTDEHEGDGYCINKWNVTQLDPATGVTLSLFESPLDGGDPPLSWLTANTELNSFIYFIPATTYGYFITQAMNPYSAIPPVSSTNTTDHIFFRIRLKYPSWHCKILTLRRMDWLEDTIVIGPCVSAVHHNSFGLCEGDYVSGETTMVLALPTNYNPKLTTGFLDREKGLYLFASQEDPSFPQDLEFYLIDVTERAYAVAFQQAYRLDESYRLETLMIYPSSESTSSTYSSVAPISESSVVESTFDHSSTDVLSAPESHTLTYVLVSLTLCSSCASAVAVVIYMQFVYRRRLAKMEAHDQELLGEADVGYLEPLEDVEPYEVH